MKTKHTHTRHAFVPPYVMEELARNGVENANISIHGTLQAQDRRAEVNPVIPELRPVAADSGQSVRQVYDCESKSIQRVKLVRSEGDPSTADDAVTQAYEYAGMVREYLKVVLNRDSIDNLGMDLIFNVHYGKNFMNAFWDGDEMTFGDGDGTTFTGFAQSLDVVAHEFAHGVTQFTADLIYKNQSGALNEHFSDVFGTAITQHVNGETANTADWLIGDEIMGPNLYGEALRSMREPGTAYNNPVIGKDPQRSHMDNYYSGQSDNGGVHINSGIPNKAFYLTAMDIGTDKATLIWYHALQNLWPTAEFKDAVSVIVNSARLLVKNGKVPNGTTQVVRAAFKAVGL